MIRALLPIAAAAAVWAAAVAVTGGFDVALGPIRIRSHSAVPAAAVALIAFAASWLRGPRGLRDAADWWRTIFEARAAAFAAAIAFAAAAAGIVWGTYAAGGPDSYCYLNQAEIVARGDVREMQAIASRAPWPGRALAFVPMGHVPAPGPEGTVVPMCPAGYPLIMAAARLVAGRAAMFSVVPLMGGLAVWLTFVLGRRAGGSLVGMLAALLLATSPTFLYQVVQPMTDVPATAMWTLAVVASWRAREAGIAKAAVAGIATGAALMIRPNLLPLAVVTGAMACLASPLARRSVLRAGVAFAVGVVPFVVAIAALQAAMYGGPFTSGYGDLDALFRLAHVGPNLQRYPVWLLSTETPFIAIGLLAPLAAATRESRHLSWWLLAFVAAAFACYLPYSVFDAWWYLRFLLPAFPAMLVLASLVFAAAVARLHVALRTALVAAIAIALVVFHLMIATAGNAFRLHDYERRFRDGGLYVADRLPENAAILTYWQSGSVRFYSGRLTVVWAEIPSDWLDRALDFLRAEGYRPYLLFEGTEEQDFRRRFDGASALGALDWPPIADINRQVRIYDPLDRERYMRGERVQTERRWTR